MKKLITLQLLMIFLIPVTSMTKVIESNTVEIVNSYATEGTLVIWDIDNTIGRPEKNMIVGSDEWFVYMVDEKIQEGYDYISAVYAVLPLCYYAQFNIWLQLTEPIIPHLIDSLTARNIPTMALTSRSLYLAERTSEQMTHLNINLWLPHVNKNDFIVPMPLPCLYKNNIIFTGNNDKGDTLLCFLDTIGYHPKKIIFIDDKLKNIHSVETALMRRQIPFIGIRYSGCDEQVHNFDPIKAQEQYIHLQSQNALLMQQ